MMRRYSTLLGLVLLGWLALPLATAQAQQRGCEVAPVPALDFGRPAANPTAAVGTTTDVVVTCTGNGSERGSQVKVCVGVSPPWGTQRHMSNGASDLLYQVLRDSHAGAPVGWDQTNAVGYMTLDQGSTSRPTGTTTVTLYGLITPGQSGLPAGSYSDWLAGQVRTSTNLSLDCGSATWRDWFFSGARAQLDGRCTIVAEPLQFGTHVDLDSDVTASAGLGLTCTAGTAYAVRLDGGSTGNPDARRMRLAGAGPQTIDYQLFQDPGHTRPWGNLPATSVGGVGSGTPTTLTVHGRVPGGQSPAAVGTYTDTVTATVEY